MVHFMSVIRLVLLCFNHPDRLRRGVLATLLRRRAEVQFDDVDSLNSKLDPGRNIMYDGITASVYAAAQA
jgi:hypothetical protein